MGISFDKALGIHEQALHVRARRTEVLASNLANADTPNYKARDIDFREALQRASSQSANGLNMALTNSRHIPGQAQGVPDPDLKYRVPFQPSLDGNTVEAHIEQKEFATNAMEYQTTLQFLGKKLSGMKNVIKGGR